MGESIAISGDVEKTAAEPNDEQRHQFHNQELAEKDANLSTQDASGEEDNIEYPSGAKVALIMVSLFLAVFLVALVSPKSSLDFPSNSAKGPDDHRNSNPSNLQ